MIQDAFNSIISSNTLAVEEIKNKVKNSASSKLKEEILQKLSDPETIKQQLGGLPVTQEQLDLVDKKYIRLKSETENLQNKSLQKSNEIQAIIDKISKVNERFDRLTGFTDEARKFLPTLKKIITGARIALNALPINTPLGTPIPGSGGGTIIGTDDKLKGAKSKIEQFEALTEVLDGIKKHITEQTDPIEESCNEAISIINNINSQINIQKLIIDQIYLQIIGEFSGLIDSDTLTQETIPQSENPEEILNNLENSNREKYIQYLKNISTGDNNIEILETGYKITKS
jgi:uncharacterized protein (UPF0305 family)